MSFVLKSLATLVVGVGLGLFVTWASVVRGGMPGAIGDGPWRTSLTIGSAASDPYTRASIALHGLLALNRAETMYYSTSRDDSGAALTANCRYEIAGRDPDARWWSITAYGSDDYLIPNAARRYSISKDSIRRTGDGTFRATVSRAPAAANWIPVLDDGFSLTLRLYNPGVDVVRDPAHARLPSIRRMSCG